MKKLSVIEVLMASDAFAEIMQREISVVLGFKIGKILHTLNPIIKSYHLGEEKLLKKYEIKVVNIPDGRRKFTIPPDKREPFLNEMEPLQKLEVEIDIEPIKLSEFEKLEVRGELIYKIQSFIEE